MRKYLRLSIATLLAMPVMAADITIKPGSVVSYTYVPKSAMTSGGGGSTAATLKVVTEGDACTASDTDNTAINATYSKILTCKGGTWKQLTTHLNVAVEGAACASSTEGDITKDAAGLILSCQSGVWGKAQSGGLTSKDVAKSRAASGTITCTNVVSQNGYTFTSTHSGYYDSNGIPYARTTLSGALTCDTGWVAGAAGSSAAAPCPAFGGVSASVTTSLSINQISGTQYISFAPYGTGSKSCTTVYTPAYVNAMTPSN